MSVVITREDLQTYAEVDYIIHHMNQRYIDKLPEKIIQFFGEYKDPTHNVSVDPYVPLQKQGLKRYTLEIIALLHLKYWCEDEVRKQELYDIMLRNQEKLEEQIKEKFCVEKLFDNASATVVKDEEDLNNKEDFTKPRMVQRYNQYSQNNDIDDYTDHVENTNQEEISSTKNEENNSVASNLIEKTSFLCKLKQKILSIFKKDVKTVSK